MQSSFFNKDHLEIILKELKRAGILTTDIHKRILDNADSISSLNIAISILSQRKILTLKNVDLLIDYANYSNDLALLLAILNEKNLLTPAVESSILQNIKDASELNKGVQGLIRNAILSSDNLQILLENSTYANDIAIIFGMLNEVGLLTPAVKEAIIQRGENIPKMNGEFAKLAISRKLIETNVMTVIHLYDISSSQNATAYKR